MTRAETGNYCFVFFGPKGTIIKTHSNLVRRFCSIYVLQQLRRLALRFIHSHSGATGVCLPICLVVYFWCGAKLTDASSKIDVRRLKEGDLLRNY